MSIQSNNGKYIPTGFEAMGEALLKGGFRPGETVVIGWKSFGKTFVLTKVLQERETLLAMCRFLEHHGVCVDSEEEVRKFFLSLAKAEKGDEYYSLLQRLKSEGLFEKQQRLAISKPDLRRGAFLELDSMALAATNAVLTYTTVGGREPKPKKKAKWKQDRFASIQQSAQSKRR